MQTDTNTPALDSVEFEPIDRSSFLLKGVLAAGAVYGATAISPMIRRAFAQSGGDKGDIEILNFALTLEYLEAEFYDVAAKDAGIKGDLAKVAKEIGDNEQEHVDALAGTIADLGGEAVKSPKFTFPVSDEASFLELAQTLEDTGVSAYNGAGPSLKSKELLGVAGAIVQVEARHAARIRFERGEPIAPGPFDPTLDTKAVLKAVEPLIAS